MSGLGRARGRGRGVFRSEEVDSQEKSESDGPKPGGAAVDLDINQVSTLVQSLTLEADDISKDMVSSALMKYADTESHAEEIMRILYIRILFDWKYAKHMAYICARLVKIPKLGTIFRTSLIRRIQLDYGNRATDREEKPRTFLGCMAFLCQVLHQVRNADNQPFRPLVMPVYQGLQLLLDESAQEKEIELAVTQLMDVGELLQKHNEEEMQKVRKAMRSKILDTTIAHDLRAKLLRLLETCAGGWKPPPLDEEEQNKPSANGGETETTTSASQSPKHASPKRVSFSNITEVSTVNTNCDDTKPTYTTATDSGYPSDFGGVWENPTPSSGDSWDTPSSGSRNSSWDDPLPNRASSYDYTWSAPRKNDNDAGQWEDVESSHK